MITAGFVTIGLSSRGKSTRLGFEQDPLPLDIRRRDQSEAGFDRLEKATVVPGAEDGGGRGHPVVAGQIDRAAGKGREPHPLRPRPSATARLFMIGLSVVRRHRNCLYSPAGILGAFSIVTYATANG